MRRLWFAGLLACGPTTGEPELTTGSVGESSTSAAGSTSISTSSSTGPPVDCSEFMSGLTGPPVTFILRNDRDVPMWVGAVGCGGAVPFALADVAGQPVQYDAGECSPVLCDSFRDATSCEVGCPNCGPPTLLRLPPGAVADVRWLGVAFTSLPMSPECFGCEGECLRGDQAPPGTYSIAVTVYGGCEGDGCECDGGPTDAPCPLYDAVTGTDPEELTNDFVYPEQAEAVVAIPP